VRSAGHVRRLLVPAVSARRAIVLTAEGRYRLGRALRSLLVFRRSDHVEGLHGWRL
jgi:hypothetical protein